MSTSASHGLSLLALCSAALAVGSAAGCEDETAPRAPNACVLSTGGAASTFETESLEGPYAVGTLTVTLVDDSRDTPAYGNYAGSATRSLETHIRYPAAFAGNGTDAAAGGPFPVVLYSHGFSSSNRENTWLANHLASHGYIVAAPQFPLSTINAPDGPTGLDIADQPADQSFVLDSLLAFHGTTDHPLEGAVDGARVAAVGLSMGGLTTLLLTYHVDLRDPRVDVAVGLAPVGAIFGEAFFATTNTPLLVVHGDSDAVLDFDPHATTVYANAQAPVALLRLHDGTHTGFTNIATLFEDDPSYAHADSLACNVLGGGGGGSGPSYQDLLGGAAAGIITPAYGGEFCPDELGVGMKPSRQLTITNTAVLTFLDAYLDADAARRSTACSYVERVLPREDDVTRSGR